MHSKKELRDIVTLPGFVGLADTRDNPNVGPLLEPKITPGPPTKFLPFKESFKNL
jgi:hypothetical protein